MLKRYLDRRKGLIVADTSAIMQPEFWGLQFRAYHPKVRIPDYVNDELHQLTESDKKKARIAQNALDHINSCGLKILRTRNRDSVDIALLADCEALNAQLLTTDTSLAEVATRQSVELYYMATLKPIYNIGQITIAYTEKNRQDRLHTVDGAEIVVSGKFQKRNLIRITSLINEELPYRYNGEIC